MRTANQQLMEKTEGQLLIYFVYSPPPTSHVTRRKTKAEIRRPPLENRKKKTKHTRPLFFPVLRFCVPPASIDERQALANSCWIKLLPGLMSMLFEQSKTMLCPSEYGALPSVVCPNRSYQHLQATNIWDKRNYPSLYKMIQDYSLEKNFQRMNTSLSSVRIQQNKEPYLPLDPRQWSRDDVASWIQYTCASNQLPSVHLERFLMNGKALCLMSIDMFVNRVPLGGKLLYKDFQLRLSRALYS